MPGRRALTHVQIVSYIDGTTEMLRYFDEFWDDAATQKVRVANA